MASKRQSSVIRRMYAGFAVLAISLIITNTLNLNGSERIHQQLNVVTSKALPLVSLSNEASLSLLAADKIFKDYLTLGENKPTHLVIEQFDKAKIRADNALDKLHQASIDHPRLTKRINVLREIETRYFTEATLAMKNYQQQQNAQKEGIKAARQFQQMNTALALGMQEYIANNGSNTLKMIAKTYFKKLRETETNTSDALINTDLNAVTKAISKNKRSITQLNYSFRSLVSQLPKLKDIFQKEIDNFTRDVSRKDGVLNQHLAYLQATNELHENINNLALEVDNAMTLLAKFRHQANDIMSNSINQANNTFNNAIQQTIFIGIAILIIAMLIGWRVARSVRNPLSKTLNVLESLTDGDMTKRIHIEKNDEFGDLADHINILASNLQQILKQLLDTAEDQTQVATVNLSTTNKTKQRLNEQKEQTSSVAQAMDQMENSVVKVAHSAQQSMDKVMDVSDAVSKGRDIMTRNISTIEQLSHRLDESVEVVSSLQEMTSNIETILFVINNIADQTNLLALNAAIEAARAGEQGRGFAVVADEVRVLAKRTSDSTSEIEEMIITLQSKSNDAVAVIQECVEQMSNSSTQASDANIAMEEIDSIIMQISQMNSQIAQAASEQRVCAKDIAQSVDNIHLIADSNFTAMQTIAKASERLDKQASEQNKLVHKFTV